MFTLLSAQDIYTILGFRSTSIEPVIENRSALDALLYGNSLGFGDNLMVMDETYNNEKADYIKTGDFWFAGFGYRLYHYNT